MKKYCVLLLAMFFMALNSQAQLTFSTVSVDGESLSTVPRYSWGIPLEKKIKTKKDVVFAIGATFNNFGIIFDRLENGQTDRHKHRTWSFGPSGGVYFGLGKKMVVGLSGTVSYNFHYKHKIFPNGNRKDKDVHVREWFSDKVDPINLVPRFSIGTKKGFMLYGEYFFSNLFNTAYTDEMGAMPFAGFEVTRFNIGISSDLNDSFEDKDKIVAPQTDVSL